MLQFAMYIAHPLFFFMSYIVYSERHREAGGSFPFSMFLHYGFSYFLVLVDVYLFFSLAYLLLLQADTKTRLLKSTVEMPLLSCHLLASIRGRHHMHSEVKGKNTK